MDQNGAYVLTLRVGSRAVEFEKGKSAISIASVDKIPSVIDTLVRAIKAGELDEQLSHTGKVPKAAATKKAA